MPIDTRDKRANVTNISLRGCMGLQPDGAITADDRENACWAYIEYVSPPPVPPPPPPTAVKRWRSALDNGIAIKI